MNRYYDFDPMKVIRPVMAGYDLYRTMKGDSEARQNNAAATEVLSDYQQAQSPDDVKFIQQTAHKYGVNDPNTMANLTKQGDSLLDQFRTGADSQGFGESYGKFQQVMRDNPGMAPGRALAMIPDSDASNLARFAKGALNDITMAYNVGIRERQEQEQKGQQSKSLADFQSSIAGLTGPSTSPTEQKRLSGRGGYAPMPEVESDIRQAAATYNVGDSDEVGKAIAEARDQYRQTYGPSEIRKLGNKTITGQSNLLGDFRKDAEDKAPINNINIRSGYGIAPRGYRFTSDGNLEPIPGGPAEKLPAGIQEDLSTTRQLRETVQAIKDTWQGNKKARKWVGMIDNVTGGVTGATDIGADKEEQIFRSLVQNQFNIQGKLRSGAAWTAPEIARLEKELPNTKNGETAFGAKLENTLKYLEKKEQQILGARQSGVPKGNTPSSPKAPTWEEYKKSRGIK